MKRFGYKNLISVRASCYKAKTIFCFSFELIQQYGDEPFKKNCLDWKNVVVLFALNFMTIHKQNNLDKQCGKPLDKTCG